LFHEEEEEEEVVVVVLVVGGGVGVVVGMEYLVPLADVGMQVFLFFQDDKEVGMQVFQDEEEVRMERLADVGIEEEVEEEEDVGNHVRKELVPYYVNYKQSLP
jgi:heterodisulfide reductase subunit A-like polyferredoxin